MSHKKNKLKFNSQDKQLPLILALDTSCDETSAAVTLGRVVLSNIIASQTNIHQAYGGVYPTLAKRAHQKKIDPVINLALKRAGLSFTDLDIIAVTLGPGLAPALEIGINKAHQLAEKWRKPLIVVNHIEAHLLSVLLLRKKRHFPINKLLTYKLENKLIPKKDLLPALLSNPKLLSSPKLINGPKKLTSDFLLPALGMVFSGGHSQFIHINKIGQYQLLGETIDDALGEALDKVGRMLGLGYPAGPIMEKLAKKGKADRFDFPLPMTAVKNFNLSYSGLKTAAHRKIKQLRANKQLDRQTIFDFSASFQQAAFKHVAYKLNKLLQAAQAKNKAVHNRKNQPASTTNFKQAWLGGGVASNIALRQTIRATLKPYQIPLKIPFEKRLCSDNAAIIGVTAAFKINYCAKKTLISEAQNLDRKPNWKL